MHAVPAVVLLVDRGRRAVDGREDDGWEGRRPGWELAHGHAWAVGGEDGSRAEILGVPLEVL